MDQATWRGLGIRGHPTEEASCTIFIPSGARTMYIYFEPQIRACDDAALPTASTAALAINPDQPAADVAAARSKLESSGFRRESDVRTVDPRIELYRQAPH